MARSICTVDGCNDQVKAFGLCRIHDYRQKLYGSPLVTKIAPYIRSEVGQPLSERFWARVAITANPDRCWNWIGGIGRRGYGLGLEVDGKMVTAHRLSWFVNHGEWPTDFVLHDCDNKKCVNPNHLHVGSLQQNVREAMERDRLAKGSKNPAAKLTESDIPKIRELVASGVSDRQVARMFAVSATAIGEVRKGLTWRHVQ